MVSPVHNLRRSLHYKESPGERKYVLFRQNHVLILKKPFIFCILPTYLKMSFYALSSGRSLAGLPVVTGMEKKPCFEHPVFGIREEGPESTRVIRLTPAVII